MSLHFSIAGEEDSWLPEDRLVVAERECNSSRSQEPSRVDKQKASSRDLNLVEILTW